MTDDDDDLTEPREDDPNLVRHLRKMLRESQRDLREARAAASVVPSPEEAVAVEAVDVPQKQPVDEGPRGLRQAYERASARLKELEAAQRGQALRATFDAAGVPEGELRDFIGSRVEDPESVTVDGLQAWMRDNGVRPADPVGDARSAAIQRVDELRANAVPVGSQKLGYGDYQQLRVQNPAAAAQALLRGEVDMPAHVTEAVMANRRDRAENPFMGS